jgi:hypothetical protein
MQVSGNGQSNEAARRMINALTIPAEAYEDKMGETVNLNVKELKVYVPAEDIALSKQFYSELGFQLTEAWGGTFDCRLGGAVFRLQNYFVRDWANNMMLQFDVQDARAWYEHARPIVKGGRYERARISEPEEVGGAIVTHIWDPCGVLLIFIQ